MILRTRNGGDTELRFGEYAAQIPSRPSYNTTTSGQLVTLDSAVGLAAVGRAIRVVSGIAAVMALRVYEGRRGDKREVPDDWRARLLEEPCLGVSDFDWRWDIFSSLEACENAFLRKVKDRKGLVELELIPHYAVTGRIDRETGEKRFDVNTANGKKTYTTNDVLHIRGQTVGGGPFGVSRITQHADPLGAMLAAQRFEGSHYQNNARPDLAILFPDGIKREQAREWRTEWEGTYGGPENAGKVVPLGGGATVFPIPATSMKDAQFVESRQYSVEEVGRIMDVDPVLLGAAGDNDARGAAVQHFLHIQLPPRLRRVERALRADPDLFGPSTVLYPESEVNELMFADPITRAQVQHYRVQDGTELVDEARADNGRGPLPPIPADPSQTPGAIPQITPVGGAVALPMSAGDTDESVRARHQEREQITVHMPQTHVEFDVEALADGLRELAAAQRNQEPIVVNVEAPQVTVEPAEVRIEPTVVNVTPELTLTVPKRTMQVHRDKDGNAVSYEEK